MIARELTDFFAGFAPDGTPARARRDDQMFLSNVNACYRRECWEQIRFADVPYAEDQAFARAMAARGWRRAYHPGAAVLHAHDYSPLGFMRRYFDEYRGLRETSGHVERIGVRSTVRDVRGLVAADRRWMREQRLDAARAARPRPAARRCTTRRASSPPRSARTRTGCRTRVQRAISLEARARRPRPTPAQAAVRRPPGGSLVPGRSRELARDGAVAAARARAGHGRRASGCTSRS